MRNKPTMKMSICQAENGFSLDEISPQIARIILKRFTNANAWEDYWQNKMTCVGNVVINIGNYKCFSQKLGQ